MKTSFFKKGRLQPVFLILLTSVFLLGCQGNFMEAEEELNLALKDAHITEIDSEGTLPDGAAYEIVLPESWNALPLKILIVYAHGYVDVTKPVALPADKIDGVEIKDILLNGIDYMGQTLPVGYASTSYRANGLVVLDAVEDILQLRSLLTTFFEQSEYDEPAAMLLAGVSEGGLITVLTTEQNPGLFDAAIATCCPIGNFYDQLQYYGHAHVLFKYFFGPSVSGINIGSPRGVSKNTMYAWEAGELPRAIAEVLQNDYRYNGGNKIRQFIACAGIPVNMATQAPEDVIRSLVEVLRFPIMATNDAIMRLGGNPYNNKYPPVQYEGSDNDRKLNLTVDRICRPNWERAKEEIANYETTGLLYTPLLSMHTEFDHVSLFSHQGEYATKVGANPLFIPVPVLDRYGHCNFTVSEIHEAIGTLLSGMP
ncbi:hypothetical protein [Sunxiuqinia rutila]|uniref:hypothetical protein n=1 Tax=Sunxiuqinia rutila TaxID=1397841 RepID=UPI003D36AABB